MRTVSEKVGTRSGKRVISFQDSSVHSRAMSIRLGIQPLTRYRKPAALDR